MSEAARQTHLQRLFALKLTQTATIRTPGGVVVDEGGGYSTGAPATTTVPCRVGPIGNTPREQAIAAKHATVSLWVVKVPAETAIAESATIEIDSQVYEVVEPLGPRTFELVRRIVCKRIGDAA